MLEFQKKHHEARMERDKELYGLTEEEIKVEEGAFKMSAHREKIFERESEGILKPKTEDSKSFQ